MNRKGIKYGAVLLAMLASLLCCSGCSQSDTTEEDALNAVREYAGRYSYLNEGMSEARKAAEVLAIYNNATYQQAKESVSMTTQLINEYFPYTQYQGASVFQQNAKTVAGVTFYVEQADDGMQHFLMQTAVQYSDGSVRYYWHNVAYNAATKKITEFKEIYHYV